jgi:hypothetical protein
VECGELEESSKNPSLRVKKNQGVGGKLEKE